MIDTHHGWNASIKPLILGFVFSIVCILAVYRTVGHMHLRQGWLVSAVVAIGCLQVIFQLIFFLHLGLESKPRWNLALFFFTLLLILIVVLGTLWIMHNLDYNLMSGMNSHGY